MSDREESSPPATEPHLTSREESVATAKWQRLLTITAALLALIAICAIAIRLGMAIHHTLLLFSLGGLVAYALDPLVELFRRPTFGKSKKRLSRGLSVLSVFVLMFLACAGGLWWLGGQAARQFRTLQEDGPKYRERAIGLAHQFDEQMLRPRNVSFSIEDSIQNPPPELNTYAERASKEALPFLAHTVTAIAESAIVLLIALYFLIFSSEMKERVNGSLSPFLLNYALPWEKDVNRILGGFVRGQLTLAVITGALAAIGLLAIGVHLWLIIGLFVVAASLIPVFGPYIGAIPAILAALIGPTHLTPVAGAVVVAVLFVVLNEGGSKILYPKLVGQALNLHEVVVLFVLFAGLEIGGIIGTLFAAPLTALSLVTIVHLYRLWQQLPEESMADTQRVSKLSPFKPNKPAPAGK